MKLKNRNGIIRPFEGFIMLMIINDNIKKDNVN